MKSKREYLRRRIVIGEKRVDGEDDLGNRASRIKGGRARGGMCRRMLERAINQRRAFHEPH